jgi:PBS lyase HEAT-like repeat
MNIRPENSPQPTSPDPLDELLSEARWPEPLPTREVGLAKRWDEVWHIQRRHERRTFRFALFGIAASLLLGVALGWTWWKRGPSPSQQPVANDQQETLSAGGKKASDTIAPPLKNDSTNVVKRGPRKALKRPLAPSRPTESVAHAAAREDWSAELPERPIVARPPTKLEEMLVMANVRSWHEPPTTPVRLTPSPKRSEKPAVARVGPSNSRQAGATRIKAKQSLEAQAVARLATHPKADPAEIAAGLRSTKNFNEARLVAILVNGSPAERRASLKLLGEIGSPRVVPDLLRATGDANLHVAAIRALSQIADSATIEQLAHEEPSKELQRVLLAALLGRGDVESLRLYVNNVVSEPMAETALAAAEQTSNPPMDLLFAVLRSPSELERLAAARVLGRIDGPATTERLIGLLEEGTSRQEACVALLTSRGQEAVNFVNSARTNPTLAAALQAASVLMSTNSPRS